jgi:hypothetical protein
MFKSAFVKPQGKDQMGYIQVLTVAKFLALKFKCEKIGIINSGLV